MKNLENKAIVEQLYRAYVYGYPLVVLELQRRTMTNTQYPTSKKAPMSQLIHAQSVSNADDKYIVMLNMDTVYSQAYFDLKEEPLYFHKPETDRYTTALFLDAYGNSVAIIGSGGIGDQDAVNAAIVGPDYKGSIPEGFVRIEMPTNLCWTLIRVLLKDEEDDPNVHHIQEGFDVRPLSEYQNEYEYPKGTYQAENEYVTFEKINQLGIEEFFEIFNHVIEGNHGAESDEKLLEAVAAYGVGANQIFDLAAFNDDVVEALTGFHNRLLQDFTAHQMDFGVFTDGWVLPNDTIAEFGTNYLYRANVAWGGIGANPVYVAMYPTSVMDHDGHMLHSDHSYVYHFQSLPPVEGFWSLTLYGDDKFLISNQWHRYGINDRSNLLLNEDGSLDIYIQRDPPSDHLICNWIPSGEKGFCAVLRLYLPGKEILDGTWKLPNVTVKA